MTKSLKRIISLLLVNFTVLSSLFIPSLYAEQSNNRDDEDFSEDQIEKNVVFVKDEGSDDNDGTSDKKAFATMKCAFSALSETGGIVVVCGKLTLDDESSSLSSHTEDIEITSFYDGVDYRSKSKAEIFFKNKINVYGSGKTYFYGVSFHSKERADIFCNGSNVRFGTKIDNVSDDGSFPSLWGGRSLNTNNYESDGNLSDFTLQVDSGYWNHVTLGNRRDDIYAPLSTIKNSSLIITGGTFLSKDNEQHLSSLVSGANVSQKLSLDISGGVFYGSFYIIGNEGPLSPYLNLKYTADIKVTISNGVFMGEYVKALYSKNASLYGKYDFSVTGGSFSSLTYIGCEGVYSDISLKSFDGIQSKLYGFEKVVYVDSKNGDDKNGGESTDTPKATLSNAITSLVGGGIVVLCSEYDLPDGYVIAYNDAPIKITSKYFDNDFNASNNAKLNLNGTVKIQSQVTFEDISFVSNNSSTLICEGEKLFFGPNCQTVGEINITMQDAENFHSLSIYSGDFANVILGSSETLTSFTLRDGSVKSLLFSDNTHNEDILLELSGGAIDGECNYSELSLVGDMQLILGNTTLKNTIIAPSPANEKIREVLLASDRSESSVSGFDIIGDKYVFVKDGANGDGSTPSKAASNTDSALNYIGDNNAIVVICGPYTHSTGKTEVEAGILTYTSLYRGIDYASHFDAYMSLVSDFYFHNDATIKNITVKTHKPDVAFRCASHIVIFDYGITCETRFLTDEQYPSIYASEQTPSNPYNEKGESLSDKITLKSGIWYNVYGSASTLINGSIIKGSLFGTSDLSNNCTIVIGNGIIYGGIYAAKSMKQNCDSHVSLNFTGGEIHGVISPSYYPTTGYKGKYKINVIGGDFSAVDEFVGPSHVGAEKFYCDVDDDFDKITSMNGSSTYSNPITSGYSTLQYLNGYWYLFEVSNDKITVKRSMSPNGMKAIDPFAIVETGGLVLDMTVSIAKGKIFIFAKNVFNSALRTRIFLMHNDDSSPSFEHLTDINRDDINSPALYVSDGQAYIYYSRSNSDGGYDICCAKLKDDMQFGTDPIVVLSATAKWENKVLSTPVAFDTVDGNTYLVYSGGDIYTGGSMIGYAKVTNPKDLLNSASYIKNPDPAVYENDIHQNIILSSIITVPDNEPYLVFKSNVNSENLLFMQSFSYDKDGAPYFSFPCDVNMQFVSFNLQRSFDSLLEEFEINVKENVNVEDTIKPPFSFNQLKTEHIIVLACGLGVMLLILIIVIVKIIIGKNRSRSPQKLQRHRLKHSKKHSQRRSGKLYAAYLEQTARSEATRSLEERSELGSTTTDEDVSEYSTNNAIDLSDTVEPIKSDDSQEVKDLQADENDIQEEKDATIE